MKEPHSSASLRQKGMISILAVFFVITAVFFVMTQSLKMIGNKSIDSKQYLDSMAAFYLAESGVEHGMYTMNNAVSLDDTAFVSSCSSIANSAPIPLGQGYFQYTKPSVSPTLASCAYRIRGTVGTASRTIESSMTMYSDIGTANFGTNIDMTLHNPKGVPAVAIFNLAWRRHGSTGYSTSGGQATASACTLPSCGLRYSIESSSGTPSVGSLGTAVSVAANSNVQVTQTLSTARNYSEVGMIMPGLAGTPVIKGSYADGKDTANNANQTVSTGVAPSGEANNWCRDADTLVFGISGRGNDDVTGAFASIVFNTNGNPAQPIPMQWIAHYPNTDGTTPNVFGDVFSEIWWTYNPTFPKVVANSVGNTITLSTPTTVKVGTIIKVYSGSGALAGNTTIASITDSTHFTVNTTPTTKLTNATICGGICALFDNPSSNGANTTFSVTRATAAAQQWAGGFTCLSGVDPSLVRRIARSGVNKQNWREVNSDEPIP